MVRGALAVVGLLASLVASSRADARDAEWRWSVGALGVAASNGDGAASPSLGGTLRWGYGLSNNLELAGELRVSSHLGTADIGQAELPNPMTGLETPGTLRASAITSEIAVAARYQFSVKHSLWFARTAPFAGVRLGLGARYLRGSYLADVGGARVFSVDDAVDVVPVVGGELGVQHRLSSTLALALVGGFTFGGSDYVGAQASLELGWFWY